MGDDPRKLGPDDLLGAPGPTRHVRDAADLAPEEAAEREAYARRLRDLQEAGRRLVGLTGPARDAAVRAELAAIEARRARREVLARARTAEIPDDPDVRDVACTPAPATTPALAAVAKLSAWRSSHPRRPAAVMFLLGPAGTGKTTAACWAVAHHDRSARYTHAAFVATHPLTAHSDSHAPWYRLVAPDLLVVDELGREDPARAATLTELVLARHAQGRVTLLLSNRPRIEVLARYVDPDDAVASRLRGQHRRGLSPLVELPPVDLRLGGVR